MANKKKKNKQETIEVEAIDNNTKIIPYELAQAIEPINKPNCKLCQSEYRAEAEERFMQQQRPNHRKIMLWLKSKGENISYAAVRNHMIYHFKAIEKRTLLKEYSVEIQKWMNIQPSKIQSLKIKIAILSREMTMLSMEGEDLNLSERRKNAETLKKLADTLLAYEEKLDECQETMEPVSLIMQKLNIIVKEELEKDSTTQQAKQSIISILNKLQKATEEMEIE
ncbi:MAG: hypothetical protein ACOCRX_11470 [Candidatus Woesearchaeota archaeon]